MMTSRIKLFTGNANPELAKKICDHLDEPLGNALVREFSDEEIRVEISENIRGADTFVIQSTCRPGNTNLMELLILIDALKRASAWRITAIIPYYGYARQDRKVKPRTPITAKLVADLIDTAGCDRVLSLDLHAGQIQGFFNIPVDNLFAMPVLLDQLSEFLPRGEAVTVVSPDPGGVERARAFAKRLNAELAIADKRREAANVAEVFRIVGDVTDRDVVIVDDIVDTAGSLVQTSLALQKANAGRILATVSHPVLSGPALKQLEECPLERLIVTDSIPLRNEAKSCEKIVVTKVAGLFGEAIRRIHNEESVSSLFV
jgi:ribose-phosphate pyrophosphokinase